MLLFNIIIAILGKIYKSFNFIVVFWHKDIFLKWMGGKLSQ